MSLSTNLPPQEGFPKEHRVRVLREHQTGFYTEFDETWRRFRELGDDNELVSFSKTGRVFRLVRRESQDLGSPQLQEGEQLRLDDPLSMEWVFFALEDGYPDAAEPIAFHKARPEQMRIFLLTALRSRLGWEKHDGEYDGLMEKIEKAHQDGIRPSQTVEEVLEEIGARDVASGYIPRDWRSTLQEQGTCW